MNSGDWIQIAGIGLTLLAMAGAGLMAYARLQSGQDQLKEESRKHDKGLEALRIEHDKDIESIRRDFKEWKDQNQRLNTEILTQLATIQQSIADLARRITKEEDRH
jgi:hypothetical protein